MDYSIAALTRFIFEMIGYLRRSDDDADVVGDDVVTFTLLNSSTPITDFRLEKRYPSTFNSDEVNALS